MTNELTPVSQFENNAIAPFKAVPQQGGALLALMEGRPKLAQALTEAIALCKPVEKEKRNEFHKYNYAGAEAIIAEAREALAKAGLVLLSIEWSLDGYEASGENRFELRRVFLLMHVSGESAPLKVVWPVCPEKGRPLDKATAAADTLSLEYLLRDLLLIPRVDPQTDVHARDDRQQQRQQRRDQDQETPHDRKSRVERLRERIGKKEEQLVVEGRCEPGELFKHVFAALERQYHSPVPPWEEWGQAIRKLAIDAVVRFEKLHPAKTEPAPAANGTHKPAPPPQVDHEQMKSLENLLLRKGKAWKDVIQVQVFDFPAGKQLYELTVPEWQDVMQALAQHPDRPTAKR